MLTKSKSGAALISGLTSLVFMLTSAFLNLLLPYWLTSDVRVIIENPESLSDPAMAITLAAIFLIAFLILTAIGAFWLYKYFGEAYFGARGAVRWALFGLLLALLVQIPNWLFPEQAWIKTGVQIVGVFAAFFLARWVVPLRKAV